MNARHRKTLAAIFTHPTPNNIRWNDVQSLIEHLGEVDEARSGSRVGFTVGERTMVTHKPHPRSVMGRASIRDIKEFLETAGISPE